MDPLSANDLWVVVLRLGGGFIAAVLGATLWSRTREGAWLVVILAVFVAYVDSLLHFLDRIGVFPASAYVWEGLNLVEVGLAGLEPLLWALALALALRRRR